MSREEVNKYLTEAMGECFHVWDIVEIPYTETLHDCRKCGVDTYVSQDFSTWQGFGVLWEWAQEQEWWSEFLSLPFKLTDFINPISFSEAVYTFLKDRS